MSFYAFGSTMADENTAEKRQDPKKKPKRFPNKNYAVKKRLPVRPFDGENVIFITKKTSFKVEINCVCNFRMLIIDFNRFHTLSTFQAQLDKCCDLLTKGEKEIILHGLGAAIQRCCNLALQLETLFVGTCQIEVNTGTVDVVGKDCYLAYIHTMRTLK